MLNSSKYLNNRRYEILRPLGRGGTSSVYLCVDSHIGKKWAVKLITAKNDTDTLFTSEIAALKSLDYYMFPRITDAFVSDEGVGIVTDYIEGDSLENYLKRDGPVPTERALMYFEELLRALIYLHTRTPRILYLDMKPANIMIMPDMQIRLVDFGIAGTMLTDGRCYGSIGYAPPEQYERDGRLNEKTDIFALGMTLYSMLTGDKPEKDLELQRKRISGNENIDGRVRELILKCTERDAGKRPDAEELLNALSLMKRHRRNLITVLVTACAVCIGFAGLMYFCISRYRTMQCDKYAARMLEETADCTYEGEYTNRGIRIICGYIDGNFLDADTKSKYSYEVGRYYFEVMQDYSVAAHYFDFVSEGDYPEAAYYKRLCSYMTDFDNEGVSDALDDFTRYTARLPDSERKENNIRAIELLYKELEK